jgi:hypothetical protein
MSIDGQKGAAASIIYTELGLVMHPTKFATDSTHHLNLA